MKKDDDKILQIEFCRLFILYKLLLFLFYFPSSSTPNPNNAKSPNVGSSGKIVFI